MPRRRRTSLLIALILFAVAVSVAIWYTNPNRAANSARLRRSSTWTRLVDQQPLQTIQQLLKLSLAREELRYARDAFNLADHATDLAFTTALRDARLHPPPETPETRTAHQRTRQLQTLVQQDQAEIKQLTSARSSARAAELEDLDSRLQLAQAELALHQDELEDAKLDLMRAGGDIEGRIQRAFTQHQSSQHGDQSLPNPMSRPAFQVPGNMLAQLRLWNELRTRRQRLRDAQQQAITSAGELARRHQDLEQRSPNPTPQLAPIPAAPPTAAASVAQLQRAAEDRKTLSEYDQRIQDFQQLGQVYGDWSALLGNQMLACVHAALQGLLWVVLIIALVFLGNVAVARLATRFGKDRRSLATMRLIGRLVVQGVGLVLILFVVLGLPAQLSTIIALAGAGLTVALKDFIVAFFGWFVLMGKNGIRVGDWVEINGIVGEVVDIGLLRTVLLETGNWAEAGHPTGRRVTFVNSFAIEGHYFNFSTTGQWLWDTLEITVPTGQDPYPVMESVLQLIQKETESTARLAEQEWQHATRNYGVRSFSAAPAINVRPTLQGTNIILRYITRANERFELRSRLCQSVVELLHGRKKSAARAAQIVTPDER